jgi:hypothetical protein
VTLYAIPDIACNQLVISAVPGPMEDQDKHIGIDLCAEHTKAKFIEWLKASGKDGHHV